MTPDRDLTILLTLKDRGPFTFRWMSYLASIHFPFKVLIADGGADDRVTRALSNRATFPQVQYEYVRYPYDATYADYYAKVDDALSRVQTPFVALADNDDFLVVTGLREAVQFLIDHPDYATCGGQCGVFWLTPSQTDAPDGLLYGERVEWKCSLDTQSLTAASASERIRHQSLRATYPIYHHVRRTEDLRKQFHIVRELNPKDLFLIEHLLCFLSAIAGKTKQLDTLYMARQLNFPNSLGAAHVEEFGDWLGRMLIPSWSRDFTNFVQVTAAALAERDGIPQDEARQGVIDAYRRFVARPLLENILDEPTVTLPMSVGVRAFRRLLTSPPNSAIRRIARTVYRRTRWISVDAIHGTEFRTRPVANAAREFKPIAEFLARPPIESR